MELRYVIRCPQNSSNHSVYNSPTSHINPLYRYFIRKCTFFFLAKERHKNAMSVNRIRPRGAISDKLLNQRYTLRCGINYAAHSKFMAPFLSGVPQLPSHLLAPLLAPPANHSGHYPGDLSRVDYSWQRKLLM